MNKSNHCYTKILGNRKLNFRDVILIPKKSNVNEVSLRVNYDFGNTITPKKGWSGVPLFVKGKLNEISSTQEFITVLDPKINDALNSNIIAKEYLETLSNINKYCLSCNVSEYHVALEIIRKLKNDYGISIKFLCINTPNGYLSEIQDITLMIKNYYPGLIIMSGNVLTPDITYDLIRYSGIDIVKCGPVKGIKEYPLFSAVLECSSAAHEAGGLLLFDYNDNINNNNSNINNIPKSFAAGADFVEISNNTHNNNNILCVTRLLKESLINNNSETLDDFFFNSKFLKII